MKRGFGSPNYDPERARSIQSQGGHAAQATGQAYRWSSSSAARAGAIGGRLRVLRDHIVKCEGCNIALEEEAIRKDPLCDTGRGLYSRLVDAGWQPDHQWFSGIHGAFSEHLEEAVGPRRPCFPKRQHLTRDAAGAQLRELLERGLAKNARRIHVYRCDGCSERHGCDVFHVGHPAC